jgi:feruloyl esterase
LGSKEVASRTSSRRLDSTSSGHSNINVNMRSDLSLWIALLGASTASAQAQAPKSSDCAQSGQPTTPDSFNTKCASIASKLEVENGVVHFSEFVAAGTNLSLAENDPSCTQPFIPVTADICRIAVSVATSNRSSFNMEAWLPTNWTGRFLSGGNGGLNGCIDYATLDYGSSLGFSSVGTNNGHNGTSGLPFYNNLEVVEDFAYRAYVCAPYSKITLTISAFT